ncbi:MAG: hypothetical protein MI725_18225 [Pirellulales bacterium]|nr:hypothetical protein [Pirellulales bacterium]
MALVLSVESYAQLTITNLGQVDPTGVFLDGVPANPADINSFKRINEGDDTTTVIARDRGQVFFAPDTGDANNGWSLTDLTVRWDDASNEYPTADFQVRLTIYPWQDLSNPSASNVDFDGGPTELPLQTIFSDVGSLPATAPTTDGDRLRFSLSSPLELRENTAYGFVIGFDRNDGTALRIDDDAFRLESMNPGDEIAGNSLGINFDYGTLPTGFSQLNSMVDDDMIFQLSGSSANIAADPFASLEVDRDTGNLSIKTNQAALADLDITGYSITTSEGRVLTGNSEWLSFADSAPADWQENGTAGPTELSETFIGGAGSEQLAQSSTINLGNAWQVSPFEDLVMTMNLAGGSTITVPTRYVSSLGSTEAIQIGDYNTNGAIDIGDWPTVRDNLLTDVSALGNFDRYQNGDMNLDGLVNHVDFLLFRTAFEAAVGPIAALSAIAVPEPTSFVLLFGAVVVILGVSRRNVLIACRVLAVFAIVSLLCVSPVEAAITFTDDGTTAPTGTLIENAGNTSHTRVNDSSVTGPGARIRGQSFTTTSELNLDAITLQMRADNPGNSVPTLGSNPMRLLVWEVGTTSVAPSDGTVLLDDSGDFPLNIDAGDFFTMDLSSSVTLQASTQYAFSIEWASALGNDIFPAQLGGFDGGDLLFNGSPATDAEVNSVNGTQDLTFFLQGTANTDDVLQLAVNTSNGAVSLQGNIISQEVISYTISGTGLDFDDGWTSLQSTSFDDGGWEEAGGSSATSLGEVRLQGSSTFSNTTVAALGTVYDESANLQDLSFSYIRDNQSVINGLINYFAGDTADYDADGDVDADDLALWQRNYGQNAGSDSDNDFDTDGYDFLAWQRQFGNGVGPLASATATVPEPTTAVLLTPFCLALVARRSRREAH